VSRSHGLLQIQGPALELQSRRQTQFLQNKGDHCLTLLHQPQVVCLCAVPFEQSKLGKMAAASFPLPEALADLKDLGIACGKEAPSCITPARCAKSLRLPGSRQCEAPQPAPE